MYNPFLCIFFVLYHNLTLGRTSKLIPLQWYKGGGGLMEPPLRFSLCYNISKSLHLY